MIPKTVPGALKKLKKPLRRVVEAAANSAGCTIDLFAPGALSSGGFLKGITLLGVFADGFTSPDNSNPFLVRMPGFYSLSPQPLRN